MNSNDQICQNEGSSNSNTNSYFQSTQSLQQTMRDKSPNRCLSYDTILEAKSRLEEENYQLKKTMRSKE